MSVFEAWYMKENPPQRITGVTIGVYNEGTGTEGITFFFQKRDGI
ncbi:hypothetical protein PVOR_29009 [Paenibacillus vortex V453]|uniref:Uncharacterized protein n=1 Tax=Paenibacillus vortex V453 TaxID=715225 RepID=A0A2R9SMS5_9BACL|nr:MULTISPECIES: hypothetical protein [Paenibacillus]EFU38652.1 hypothetical protein PVOR_29009 [Paenibacillus vortex V453]